MNFDIMAANTMKRWKHPNGGGMVERGLVDSIWLTMQIVLQTGGDFG